VILGAKKKDVCIELLPRLRGVNHNLIYTFFDLVGFAIQSWVVPGPFAFEASNASSFMKKTILLQKIALYYV
jgi:hypothetical protein